MVRGTSDAARVRQFMRFLGEEARGPGCIYLVGGSSAVIVGWRETSVDVDLKMDTEPPGIFEAILRAKEKLDINIELAAPDDFLPPLPKWRERSRHLARYGPIDFFHYDFYAQVLAKIERGHEQDLRDIEAIHRLTLIDPIRLRELFVSIEPSLIRYPAIDANALRDRVLSKTEYLNTPFQTMCRGRRIVNCSFPSNLPGADLVRSGIESLAEGEYTIEALLVTVGAPRMRAAGLDIPKTAGWPDEPELALYGALCQEGSGAHSRYNALIRRLVSFERALDRHHGKQSSVEP